MSEERLPKGWWDWDEELANWREKGIDRVGDGSWVVPPDEIASVTAVENWLIVVQKNGEPFMLVKGVIKRPALP